MPWKVAALSVQRSAFLTALATGLSVAKASLLHGISPKTGYKWRNRWRADPLASLCDRPRKPLNSPLRTSPLVENAILELRDRFGWGPQKLHDYFRAAPLSHPLPSARTIANILVRHNRVLQPAPALCLPQSFQRPFPNQLWQFDFKGDLEIGRQRVNPFVTLDDCSRYLLALKPCLDKTTRTAWDVLWMLFEIHGLPDAVLSDNAFSGQKLEGLPTLSWIEMCLIRLSIKPLHGRPYHPQTQGKVERLNGTIERELFPRVRKDALAHFEADCDLWRSTVYNTLRPHEALGGLPPVSRWMPSSKKRPTKLPEITYPPGALLRRVGSVGDVRWKGYRILGGRGLLGQVVRIVEDHDHVALFYGTHLIRKIPLAALKGVNML